MITGEKLEEILRTLAKSNYWQTIYTHCKEGNALQLFRNHCDYTSLQIDFVGYLNFYSSLYFDIAMGDVSDVVLENSIYEDAYHYYKIKSRNKKDKKKPVNDKYTESLKIGESNWHFPRIKGK